jgi:uncharacterized LabA/DUF88 family protein
VDRCALFVDAGYLLADGAMAAVGTRRRDSVSWDYPGLLKLLTNLAEEETGLPLLRCYWYEATVEGRRTPEHDAMADLPSMKLRLSRMRPGRREGVDAEIHRDLTTLARNGAISDAIVVSDEEDLGRIIADVQDLGMRVALLHVTVDGNWTISRSLRQECDGIIEIAGLHLQPYVELIAGAEPAPYHGAYAGGALGNGHPAAIGPPPHPALAAGQHPGPPAIYTSPAPALYRAAERETGQRGPVPAAPPAPAPPAPSAPAPPPPAPPAPAPPVAPPPPAPPRVAPPPVAPAAAAEHGPAAPQGPAAHHVAAVQQVAALQQVAAAQIAAEQQARTDEAKRQAAPRQSSRAPQPGAANGGAPSGGPADAGPSPQPNAQPPRAPGAGAESPPRGRHSQREGMPQPGPGQPGGNHPGRAEPQAPLEQRGMPAPGTPGFPAAALPARAALPPAPAGPQRPGWGPGYPGSPSPPGVPSLPAQHAPYGRSQQPPAPAAPSARSGISDAVQAAHAEGHDFGESVARDAPALWLEAVLARRPRMPSDLEARLLQGSSLPIDYLLHDEVRHALRRGFWDALEHARR